jgi:hypothetical protein
LQETEIIMSTGSVKSVLTAALLAFAVSGCATRPAPEPEPTGPTQEEIDRERADAAARAEREANERALREAREMLRQAREYTNLNADQQNRLRQAEQAINANEGRRAHDLEVVGRQMPASASCVHPRFIVEMTHQPGARSFPLD